MTRTIAIHQPEYFPWLGFLDKARQADVLVLLDHVQFDRSSLQHRAKIQGPSGVVWLTIPFVHKFPQRIDEVEFADKRWAVKHQKSIQACYGRAPGYRSAAPTLERFFGATYDRLVDAGVASCELLLDAFDVKPREVVRSRTLEVSGEKGELVVDICKKLGGTRYLSGRTGATYLGTEMLSAHGLELAVQSFTVKPYGTRTVDEMAPGLSALDAWLHLGDAAPAYFETEA